MEPTHSARTTDTQDTQDTDLSLDAAVPAEGVLELNHVQAALGHSRRRYLCYTLWEDTEWTLDDLARKVAAWENDIPEDEVTDQQQERVYLSLYHAHIPKLAEEGVLRFDEATETITATENAEQVLVALNGMGASLDSIQEAHARSEMDG